MSSDIHGVAPMKVFVSYTHDSREHDARVLGMANDLRARGFDCDLDQYHSNQRWPTWMEEKVEHSEKVIVVCTETYLRRWKNDEKPGVGLGAQWECLLTKQWLYESPKIQEKFVPVVFDRADLQYIPTPLRDVTRVVMTDGIDALVRRLLNIAPAEMPPVRVSVPPLALAPDFFSAGAAELSAQIGLYPEEEELISNLLPVSTPDKINTAKVARKKNKKGVAFGAQIKQSWENHHQGEPLPVGYLIEDGILYTFEDLGSPIWADLFRRGVLHPYPPKQTSEWSESESFADKNRFIKLLNRALDQLCAESETESKLGFSKQMKCYLFRVQPETRVAHLKVRAIKMEASRMIYKAIPNKLSEDPDAIQHWQHEAFRYRFQRFGSTWYFVVIPFWAFTADGIESPSRWQKTSSANMRKPEKNRAVLGHVMFWAAVLGRDADLLRPAPKLMIHPPARLQVTPSINDGDWVKVAKEAERNELETDMAAEVLL